ncbi:uncharacterized protein [Panulirus ornatus]|uniref:uncharacterized protein isoform X3 n=1 Tax=Panulirus ornatus TaxID=150431 RepID=UPI003A892586
MFWLEFRVRQEVVELMNFSPADVPESEDVSCSCNQDCQLREGYGCPLPLVSQINQNQMNNWSIISQGELLSQESVNTKHTEKNKISSKDDQPSSHVKINNSVCPAWLKDSDFLEHLTQEVEKCYSDSESDNEMKSLRKCLGKRLQQGMLPHHHSFDSFQGEFKSVDSHDEWNTACLTIDVTYDMFSDTQDDLLHGTYISANTDGECFLDKRCSVSDLVQDYNKTLRCDSIFNCTSARETLQQNLTDVMNSEIGCGSVSQHSPVETLKEAQKFCVETCADLTAPHDSIKPDVNTTFTLIKAPKKKQPYVSQNIEKILPMKKQLYRDYEELCEKVSSFIQNPDICKQSSFKSSTKTVHSSGSSCQSFVTVAEEFLYEDAEAGVQLIERVCSTSAVVASLSSTASRVSLLSRHTTSQKTTSACADQSLDLIGTITDSVKAMNVDELCLCLKNLGHVPGPIVPTTHRTYQRLLLKLRKNPHLLQQNDSKSTPQYPREMQTALKDPLSVDWESWASLEKAMSTPFSQPDPTRYWRDGTNKTCFNYLLLDPRITQDLPLRASVMDEKEKINCFISAIFYIGKGSRGRPYFHLYEAIKEKACGTQLSDKSKRIREIWSEGVGVVSLHVFQNTIPVEAWTREASMISAIVLVVALAWAQQDNQRPNYTPAVKLAGPGSFASTSAHDSSSQFQSSSSIQGSLTQDGSGSQSSSFHSVSEVQGSSALGHQSSSIKGGSRFQSSSTQGGNEFQDSSSTGVSVSLSNSFQDDNGQHDSASQFGNSPQSDSIQDSKSFRSSSFKGSNNYHGSSIGAGSDSLSNSFQDGSGFESSSFQAGRTSFQGDSTSQHRFSQVSENSFHRDKNVQSGFQTGSGFQSADGLHSSSLHAGS